MASDDDETFYKRPGTTDVGKPFEDLSIAHYILKFLREEKLTNFKLSSNDNNYGAFDDIILEIKNNNKFETYAIQLKHVNNKQLTVKALEAKSGNFSLKKYYESFTNDIKKPCQLILFSNIKFGLNNNQKDKDNIQIQFGNDTLKICKKDLDQIISTSGNCYQFELVTSNSPEIDEYKEFFDNFFLYTDQPNVKQVEESIKTMFQEMFGESADYYKYTKFIDEWSKPDKIKEKLNKKLIQRIITLLLVKPFIAPFVFSKNISENMKIFRETISEYNITTFDEEFRDKVTKLWGNKLALESLNSKVEELNKIRVKYQMDCDYIKNINEVDEVSISIFLWLLDETPLILSENEIVYNAIKLCNNEKFVLLQKIFHRIKFENCRILQNLNDLNNDKILTNFKWCIQEKTENNLNYLIKLNKDFNKCVVTTNELIQMLESHYKIDDGKENLPKPYIERQLTKIVIDYQYLDKIDKKNTIILIDCVSDKVTNKVINKFKPIKLEHFLKEDKENANMHDKNLRSSNEPGLMLISEEICEKDTFDKLCAKETKLNYIFHFRVDFNGNLEWIRSKGDSQTLEKFRLNNVYINEKDLCSTKIENEINLIITEAGMGKSELLKHFKNYFFANYWTVLLTPKDMISLCNYFSNQTINSELFFEYLLNDKFKHVSNFDKEVLMLFLKKNKTIYLWDALDELSEERQEKIIKLISQLSKNNNCCQWITSRRHLKQKLETSFKVLSRELVPFDSQQQVSYIKERLSNLNNIEEITEIIMKSISQINDNNILAIPLQIFMMTELFHNNSEKYLLLIKDFFPLTDLYQYFIEEKFNHFFKEKARISASNYFSKIVLEMAREGILMQYETIAIKTIFPSSVIEKLKINCKKVCKDVADTIGLISEINEDRIQFVHITFAEYLAANYFTKNREIITDLKEVIFQSNYTNVRLFFDLLLAKNSEAHIALLYKNYDYVKNIDTEKLKNYKDLGGRNLLQLACSWGQRYSFLNLEKDDNFFIIDEEDDTNNEPDSSQYIEILTSLLQIFDIEDFDNLFKMKAFEYAEKTDCIYAKIKILQKRYIKIDDKTVCNLLYYSAKFSYSEALKLFKNIPFIITKQQQNSILHLSVHCEDYISNLIKFKSYQQNVNYKNRLEETALYKAASSGFNKVAEILLLSGAKTDVADYSNRTPLHSAASGGHDNIVSLLIKSGADVKICDEYGQTPLHYAASGGHDNIMSLLIKSGADVKSRNIFGKTPLHCAASRGHDNVVLLLIESGADVKICDEYGQTPLHYAASGGHDNIMSLLIKSGADVKICDEYGKTPPY